MRLKMPPAKGYICAVVMKKSRWPAILMILAILVITGFQLYWLKNNYDREKQNLQITTSASFRQTILHQQAIKLKLEKLSQVRLDSFMPPDIVLTAKKGERKNFSQPIRKKESAITLLNLIQEKMKDSLPPGFPHRGIPGISVGATKLSEVRFDSIRGKDQALALSTMVDSLLGDPARISNVNVQAGKNSSDKIITISVDKSIPRDVVKFKDSMDVFVRKQLPRPRPGNIVLDHNEGFPGGPGGNQVFKFLYDVDSLSATDSITVKDITKAYTDRLKEDKINIAFNVQRLDSTQISFPNTVTIGFTKPATFGLFLDDTFSYMLDKLKLPILFSLLLVSLTVLSFVLLYRNIMRQQRLGELKNEFISNITHELKTPIATVGVAIEALKNFNAIEDAERTKEYLDISQNELQRLNLLVDKVLKLSVFEKKEIELKKERFDCRQLTEEVMNSMKLQFEKFHAVISLQTEGDKFMVEADKLHITSVIYNLLDNALKYSKDNPVITVRLQSKEQHLELSVEDNGIGIPEEYKGKVFDKFFRVPTGDKHNAKGYGLGLSYVSEVLKRHLGFITVDSKYGQGSIFTAYLPYKELPVIHIDEHRKIRKKIL